jgi:hypothetical protein
MRRTCTKPRCAPPHDVVAQTVIGSPGPRSCGRCPGSVRHQHASHSAKSAGRHCFASTAPTASYGAAACVRADPEGSQGEPRGEKRSDPFASRPADSAVRPLRPMARRAMYMKSIRPRPPRLLDGRKTTPAERSAGVVCMREPGFTAGAITRRRSAHRSRPGSGRASRPPVRHR